MSEANRNHRTLLLYIQLARVVTSWSKRSPSAIGVIVQRQPIEPMTGVMGNVNTRALTGADDVSTTAGSAVIGR